MFERQLLNDGTIRLAGERCTGTCTRRRPGVLLMTIDGDDSGQITGALFDEIAAEHGRFHQPLQLLFDLSAAKGPSTRVMQDWTAWFRSNAARLQQVTILVRPESKLVHLSVSIAQHLSRTGDLIRIVTETEKFQRAVAEADRS